MEPLISSLLAGDLSTSTLLLLFILGLLTKRFVPWWTYEAMEQRLRLYEQDTPSLIKEVKDLLDTIDALEEERDEGVRKSARRPHANNRQRPRRE